MTGSMVSWQDYQGLDGFQMPSSAEDIAALNKALVAGSDINNPGAAPGVGFPLRVESLEQTLKNTTFRMEHIRLWRQLPKIPAYNTIEEYNQITSYGPSGLGTFIDEGALPEEADSTYERKTVAIKYKGIQGRVTHQMLMLRPAHGNVLAQEAIAKTMKLLESIETDLYEARSDLDGIQWEGFEQLIERDAGATNVIDLRGRPLSEDIISDAALTIMDAPNYGIPTHLFLNPKNKADFVKTFFPRARFDQFTKTDQGMVGLDLKGMTTPAGDISLQPDVFITDGGGVAGLVGVGDASKRPNVPVPGAVTSPVDAASLFTADDAGNYFYWATATNKFGTSAPVQVNAVTAAIAAGDKATFTLTPGAGPVPAYYTIYRTGLNGAAATARRILRVRNAAGMGAQTIDDFNARLPGCYSGYLFQLNLDNMAFKQLAPMFKVPLGTQDLTVRWIQALYGAPLFYTPKHNVLFRNIGRSADFVGAP